MVTMEETKPISLSKYYKLVDFVKTLLGQRQVGIWTFFVIVVVSFFILVGFALIVFLALNPELSFGFFNGVLNIYFGVDTVITPANWGFYVVWFLSFILLMAFYFYSIFAFFITTENGPLILDPPVIAPSLFIVMDIGLITCMIWMLAVDGNYLGAALALNVFAIVALMIANGLLAVRYVVYRASLRSDRRYVESSLILLTGLSGLSMLIAWLVYLAFVNMSFILPVQTREISSIVSFISLGIVLVIFFIADITIIERSSRFVLAPYIVMAIALAASVDRNYDPTKVSSLINIILLAMAVLGCLAKLMVSIYVDTVIDPNRDRKETSKKMNEVKDAGQYLILESEEQNLKKMRL